MSEAKKSWTVGVSLVDAPLHFATPSLRSELARQVPSLTNELGPFGKAVADYQGLGDEDRRQLGESINQVKRVLAEWSARSDFERKCRKSLLESLFKEKLQAYGIAKGSGTPSLIPAFLFQYPKYANWEESCVVGNELEFISVRIVRPVLAAAKANVRERRSAKLVGIIREFWKDPAFSELLRKSQANKVRSETIKRYPKLFPSGRYADIKTISRYLRQYIPAD